MQCQLPARHTPEDPQNRPLRKMLSLLLCFCYLLRLLCILILTILTLSLNGKTYLTESRFSAVSTSTEDVFGKSSLDRLLRPFPPTLLHLNHRHLRHLQIIRLLSTFGESPSSHQTLFIVFYFRHHFWNLDFLDSLAQSSFLHQLRPQKKEAQTKMAVFLFLIRLDKSSTYFEQHDVIAVYFFSKVRMFASPDTVSRGIIDSLEIVGAQNNTQIPE